MESNTSKTGLLDLQPQVQIPGVCTPARGTGTQLSPADPILQRTVLRLSSAEDRGRNLLHTRVEEPEEKSAAIERRPDRSLEEKCALWLHFFPFSVLEHSLSPAPLPLQALWDSARGRGRKAVCRSTGTPAAFLHPLQDQPYRARLWWCALPFPPPQVLLSLLVPGMTLPKISTDQRFSVTTNNQLLLRAEQRGKCL